MAGIGPRILDLLEQRKEHGAWQTEIESMSGYSKSHLSETISEMERKGIVIKRKEGNILNRIWKKTYFPGILEGTVRAGILRSSEYLPALNVMNEICLKKGIGLQVRIFSSSVEMLEALYSESLEIAMAPAVTQIIYAAIRGDLHFISPVASGGSGIYCNPASVSRTCSGSEISTMSLMTKKFLGDHPDISYSSFDSPMSGVDDLLSGKVRYLAIWQPYCTLIESHESISKTADYRSLMEEMPCCIASCSTKSLNVHGETFRDFRRQYAEFCSSGSMKPGLMKDNFNIFEGEIQDYVSKSIDDYTFQSEVKPAMIRKIAEENGLLVTEEKMNSWMNEFLSSGIS